MNTSESSVLSILQREFRKFFRAKLKEYRVKSPKDLATYENKAKFFTEIKKQWPKVKKIVMNRQSAYASSIVSISLDFSETLDVDALISGSSEYDYLVDEYDAEQVYASESSTSTEAKKLGLKHFGFGKWGDPKTRKITHITVHGKLLPAKEARQIKKTAAALTKIQKEHFKTSKYLLKEGTKIQNMADGKEKTDRIKKHRKVLKRLEKIVPKMIALKDSLPDFHKKSHHADYQRMIKKLESNKSQSNDANGDVLINKQGLKRRVVEYKGALKLVAEARKKLTFAMPSNAMNDGSLELNIIGEFNQIFNNIELLIHRTENHISASSNNSKLRDALYRMNSERMYYVDHLYGMSDYFEKAGASVDTIKTVLKLRNNIEKKTQTVQEQLEALAKFKSQSNTNHVSTSSDVKNLQDALYNMNSTRMDYVDTLFGIVDVFDEAGADSKTLKAVIRLRETIYTQTKLAQAAFEALAKKL